MYYILSLLLLAILPDTIKLHDITSFNIETKEEVVVIPEDIEKYIISYPDKKTILLHPKKEGKYHILVLSYNESTKEINTIVYPITVIAGDIPPEPTPKPESSLKQQIEEVFNKSITDKSIAKVMSDTIDAVISLYNNKRIANIVSLRETMRYNMKIRLKDKTSIVDKYLDEAIIVPYLEKKDYKTLEEYISFYTELSSILKGIK